LFTLGAEDDTSTETGRLFEGTEIRRKKKKADHDTEEIQGLQNVSNITPV
jgi:DNA excision repair protein ERCC-6